MVVSLDIEDETVVFADIVNLPGDVGATLGVVLADVGVFGSVNQFGDVVGHVVILFANVSHSSIAEVAGCVEVLDVGEVVVDALGVVPVACNVCARVA